jgi:hypothetical protein
MAAKGEFGTLASGLAAEIMAFPFVILNPSINFG